MKMFKKALEGAKNKAAATTKTGNEYFKKLHSSKEHKAWRSSVDAKNKY